jgi:hypothetical protein
MLVMPTFKFLYLRLPGFAVNEQARADHPQHMPALSWLAQAIIRCETAGSIELLPMVTPA